jgi:hypothetical protein
MPIRLPRNQTVTTVCPPPPQASSLGLRFVQFRFAIPRGKTRNLPRGYRGSLS